MLNTRQPSFPLCSLSFSARRLASEKTAAPSCRSKTPEPRTITGRFDWVKNLNKRKGKINIPNYINTFLRRKLFNSNQIKSSNTLYLAIQMQIFRLLRIQIVFF